MAAETLTASTLPTGYGQGLAGALLRSHYVYEIADTAMEDGDIWQLGYIPKNALVSGGFFVTDDLDTGTEVLDMDLGYAANTAGAVTWKDLQTGVTYTNAGNTASAEGLVNGGVMAGDAIVGLHTAGLNYRPILLPYPLWFADKTILQVKANVPANAGAAGTFSVYLDYQITG